MLILSTSQHVWSVLVGFDRGMGAFQLPDSVEGAAIACLLYSALCLIANVVLVWLVWVHRERTSCEFITMGGCCAALFYALVLIIKSHHHRCRFYILFHPFGHSLESCSTALRLYPVGRYYDMAILVWERSFGRCGGPVSK